MKIILLDKVKNLGNAGDLTEASDGYARNFLFPRKLAIEATEENLAQWKEDQKEKKKKEAEDRAQAEELKKILEKEPVILKAKGGTTGKLFGAVTSKDLEKAVQNQLKVKLDRKKIELKENIKEVGVHTVEVRVYPEMTAKLRVDVQVEN